MTKVGIGLIGCGGMGMYVAREVLKQDPRLEVRALLDPDPRSIRMRIPVKVDSHSGPKWTALGAKRRWMFSS